MMRGHPRRALLAAALLLAGCGNNPSSGGADGDSGADSRNDPDAHPGVDPDSGAGTDVGCPPGWHPEGGECVPDPRTCPYLGGRFALVQRSCSGSRFSGGRSNASRGGSRSSGGRSNASGVRGGSSEGHSGSPGAAGGPAVVEAAAPAPGDLDLQAIPR